MQPKHLLASVDDYLSSELNSSTKHEYVDGEIYAMAGASRRHNLLVGNLFSQARNAASHGSECQVFASDMKLYVEARNSFYYPDVMVCCDRDDRDDRYANRPCFIAEVLSRATASIDRREKRAAYETLPSLREYLIVDQDRMHVHVYRRESKGWTVQLLTDPHDAVELSCLMLILTVGQIYEGVELPSGVGEEEPPDYVYG
jgi:Uma2 family endonuclease